MRITQDNEKIKNYANSSVNVTGDNQRSLFFLFGV